MMRVIGIALVLVCVAAISCSAASFDLYAERNLISFPNVPLDSSAMSVFATSGVDPSYNLTKWLVDSQGYASFDPDYPEDFGGVLLGDGYWLLGASGVKVEYAGLEDGVPATTGGTPTDMWISLPGKDDGKDLGGRHIIGCPFAHPVSYSKISFTDGVEVKSWEAAVAAEWVNPTISYWTGFGYDDVWFDGSSEATELQPGMGYWVLTNKDNLAMIVLGS